MLKDACFYFSSFFGLIQSRFSINVSIIFYRFKYRRNENWLTLKNCKRKKRSKKHEPTQNLGRHNTASTANTADHYDEFEKIEDLSHIDISRLEKAPTPPVTFEPLNESAISDKVKSSSQTTCQDLSVIREARYLEEYSDNCCDSDVEQSERDLTIRAKIRNLSGRRGSSGRVVDGGFGDDEGDGDEDSRMSLGRSASGKIKNGLVCKPSDTSDYVSDIGTGCIRFSCFFINQAVIYYTVKILARPQSPAFDFRDSLPAIGPCAFLVVF